MRTNLKITVAIACAFVLVIGVLLIVSMSDRGGSTGNASSSGDRGAGGDKGGGGKTGKGGGKPAAAKVDPRLVRPDSHRLQAARGEFAGKATFVEFLDFECPSCGQAFPAIEDLRKKYAGRVTFVVRYLPLPMHANAEPAARAVEAGARQGKFEQMYKRMYEAQPQWAGQETSQDAFFRTLARQAGLDMKKYDKDYKDPAVLARVKKDAKDAQALGVTGTPTFFLNGDKLSPESYQDLIDALDKAIAQ